MTCPVMNIFEKYPNSTFLKGLPDDSDFSPFRERIGELFRFLDGLEDPHFEQQLDRDPHARLWEMMLAKILKSEGYEPKSTDHGPDFVIERDGKRVFIEAICPGPGDEDNPNSVPPIVYGAPIAQEIPVSQIVLRIRSALGKQPVSLFAALVWPQKIRAFKVNRVNRLQRQKCFKLNALILFQRESF